MRENDFDTNGGLMENTAPEVQSSDNSGDVSGAGAAGANPAADDNPAGQGGSAPGAFQGDAPSWGAPAFPQAVSQARKDKLASILAGTYSSGPHYPELNAAPPGAPGMHQEPGDGPLIGPDGGMVGRGIKAAGDWYQGYINEHREGLMEEMKDKLTPSDGAVDAMATVGNSLTTGLTGIKTDYEPRYPINKVFELAKFGPVGLVGAVPAGLLSYGRAILPAGVQGMRWAAGDTIKPDEAAAGIASVAKSTVLGKYGVQSSQAQGMVDMIDKYFDAGVESNKVIAPEY